MSVTEISKKPSGKPVRTAITPTRAENYAEWYQQVVKESDMAEMSGIRGCMILKPWGYGIWELLQQDMDRRIKATGHENCYFPLFIPLSLIEKEAAHVEGFAKEMAVVTHHRLVQKDGKLVPDGLLEEPLVVRPTSETVIGEAFARWIKSYRDLPVLINQWANVVRWEMRPRILLRTVEFLWQEGHTAHLTKEEAQIHAKKMLRVYQACCEEVLALPVIPGEKTPDERFPGAVDTYCIEAMMQDGRALQAGTSHYLGQNFSKAANIQFTTRDGNLAHVHTTSFGSSTRLLGGLVMTHADDNGMRVPPRVAPTQVVIIPIIRDEADRTSVMAYADTLAQRLNLRSFAALPVRAKVDSRDMPAQDKRWTWIKRGAPLICEVGPKDMANSSVALTRRDRMADPKRFIPLDQLVNTIEDELSDIQQALYTEAETVRRQRVVKNIKTFAEFQEYFARIEENPYAQNGGFVQAPWYPDTDSVKILETMGVTIRCLPLTQTQGVKHCILTGKTTEIEAIFARAY